ncbi:hypothetical protein GUITHDRAFT_152055 [Guillardia theta CCMP2712]|uniref:Uncharacterized protein n=2 Tax=Guillardia theta TaxID=55529 RepID=L1JGN1_GUITC|nr:hypothetical protein GUITHDRAFT_152055 [Guillardia theta CCMP2712]EKX47683.1 hypothetical protein GUITHDRAFT_152055 [Guillardia theta CCMP2712]|eukprot:XP_005834663.1 hypothetical protein GUITHDRAFT_152055 [Guillardia theta CCMP2712]
MLPYKSLTRARDRRDGMRTASKSHGEATEKSKTGSSFALPLASSPRMMDRIDLRTIRMHSRMLYDEVVTTSDLWSFKRKESLHASSAVNGGSSLPPLQRVKNERVLDLASRPFYWAHPPPPASQLVVAPYGLKPSLVYQQL